MISGKAMIATDVGGTTDMIDHEATGLLVAPDDAGALAAAMRRLIDDAALRERLGRAGQASAAQFTGHTIATQFEQLYRHLIEPGVEIANCRLQIADWNSSQRRNL